MLTRRLFQFPVHRILLSLLFWVGMPARGGADLFVPAMLPDSGYTETFSISADLEQGGFAQIQLGITNMGPGSGRAICRVLLVAPKAAWRSQGIVAPGEWRVRPAPGERLQIGGCTAQEGERPVFTATTDEGVIEIVLETALAPHVGAAYKARVKSGAFSVTPLAAGARAKVTLRPRSGAVSLHPASVYIEHDLGTVSPDQLGQQWFRFRTADGGPVRYGFAHRLGKGNGGAGRYAASVTSSADFTGLTLASSQEPGNGPVSLTASDRTITLRPIRTLAAYAPLGDMGLIGRVLSAIVGDPLLSILEVTWEEGAERRRAILEVTTFR